MYDIAIAISEAFAGAGIKRLAAGLSGFCGLNTLVGYGALAEAMARWQAAQVSALITLTPLFTLLFSDLLSLAWPDVFARPLLNLMGYLGAFVVVAGAMYSAVGHRLWGRWRKREAVVPLPRSGE